jgi:oxygen-independent coproporphyrinogen-3 oxidase
VKTDVYEDYIDAFLSAVIRDIKEQVDFFNVKKILTAYIGGGTPSVLGEKIRVLFDALKNIPGFSPDEFTIEANPESVTEEFLRACVQGGVTRLSLGVQTFHEPSRFSVNRAGGARLLEEKLALVSRYFPGALSCDLITGLPYQSEQIVIEDIRRVLAFKPAHVSLYSLSTEAGTALEEKIKTKTVILPGEDMSETLWLSGREALVKAGFRHYEISNFARDGGECLHNIRYWLMEGWLAAGPSSSGTIIDEENGTAKRFTYRRDIDAYIKNPSIHSAVFEELDRDILIKESLLMGYRCRQGPDAKKFKRRFGRGIEECIGQTLTRWKNRDIMLFLNSFLTEAFSELDAVYLTPGRLQRYIQL